MKYTTTLDTEWKDPYKIRFPLTKSQKKYLLYLQETFKVYNLKERALMQYIPTNWQQEFHAYSLNALHPSQWADRLLRKGRGISFSVSSMMDLITTANKFGDMTFPVVSHRQVAGWDLIKVGQKLIDDANIDFEIKKPFGKWTAGSIKFKNNSEIKFFPSGNPDSLRQVRTFSILFDECNFYRDIKAVLDAGEDCLNQGGQATLGSTVYDRTNYFWELCEQQAKIKRKYLFTLPTFDKDRFDINTSIKEQVQNGLQPLVWWVDIGKLEDKRKRDYTSLMRENMCQPSDEGVNFIKIQHILKNIPGDDNNEKSLVNYQNPYITENPLLAGLDIATEHDLAALSIFELTPFGWIQRHLMTWKGIELQDLQRIVENYMIEWNLFRLRIDMTGLGTQLAQSMKRKFGSKVEPIHFAKKIKTGLDNMKESIRDKMAYNMRDLLVESKVKLLDDSLQIKHLNSWSWDLKTYHGSGDHGDIFWANSLALLPLDYRSIIKSPLRPLSTVKKQVSDLNDYKKVSVEW